MHLLRHFSFAALTVLCSAAGPTPAWSQEGNSPELGRIEITGSSIKRINGEAALPVTVITQDDIKKSGVTSVTDLVQSLPAMQGYLAAGQSVNGGGGGNTNASLHSIGSNYTLVLLNGRRMAPYNTGTTVNLNSVPLSAIERVEVLTDGASALYGADAIAGVVNFILKKNSTDGEISASTSRPDHRGGAASTASVSKGFGDLDADRFNVYVAASFDHQSALRATDRDFSKTGIRPFEDSGRSLTTFVASTSAIPGSVLLNTPTGSQAAFYSPDQLRTGSCPPGQPLVGGVCRYDFPSRVESIPESERTNLSASAHFKVSDSLTLFSEVALSNFQNKPMYAAPAQPGIFLTQKLYDAHVAPYLSQLGLTASGIAPVGDPNFFGPSTSLRVFDAGGRQDEYKTKMRHYVIGGEGTAWNWDYSGYLTHSESVHQDIAMSGYLSSNAFKSILEAGTFDPLQAGPGEAVDIIAPAVLHQVLDESKSSIDVVGAKASRPLFTLSGGDVALGLGAEFISQTYKDTPSAIAQGQNSLQPDFTDTPIGGSSGALPFNSSRKSTGFFSELVAPVTKALELSAAVRHDRISDVTNDESFDSNGKLAGSASEGATASATTYKVGARYQPVSQFLVRGSYGTGFKAPTLADITSPVQFAGFTGFHDCPPGLPANLAAFCRAGTFEYNLRSGGNPLGGAGGLQPEKSTQWTVGFRYEPGDALTFGVDLWNVELRQRIGLLPEDVAFSDGATYAANFSIAPDPITGQPTLTLTQSPSNLGKARYRGLDFDVGSRVATPIGRLSTRATATYMLRSDYEVSGLPGYQSSLGKVGADGNVTFRWLANLTASLETGAFTNTVTAKFKPHYHDQVATLSSGPEIHVLNPDGTLGDRVEVTRDVASYFLLDWQGSYRINKQASIAVGVRNIFDRDPPFSIQDESATGNVRGYDVRYTDPIGRTLYVTASFKF